MTQPEEDKANSGQERAINFMLDFANSPKDKRMMRLEGGAGSGKSWTIRKFIEEWRKDGNKYQSCVICAPTHKAVGVLDIFVKKYKLRNVERCTIYRLLGLQMNEGEDERRLVVAKKDRPVLNVYPFAVPDECSMIGSKLWNHLQQEIKRPLNDGIKFIFVGDSAQLAPVGEPISPTFKIDDAVELTETVRQAEDSRIIDAVLYARSLVIDGRSINLARFEENNTSDRTSEGIWNLCHDEWMDEIEDAFRRNKDNPDAVKVITWRNRTADELNLQIRDRLYSGADFFQIGEPLIAKEAIYDPNDENVILMSNSEDCIVTSSRPIDFEREHFPRFSAWRLTVKSLSTGSYHRVIAVEPNERRRFDLALAELANKARNAGSRTLQKGLWQQFWNIQKETANLSFPYCLTVRRSQGSTYRTVFPHMADLLAIDDADEQARAVYVGLSRASDQLFLRM